MSISHWLRNLFKPGNSQQVTRIKITFKRFDSDDIVNFSRDNVEWTEEQEKAAKKKVSENNHPLPPEKQGWVLFLSTSHTESLQVLVMYSFYDTISVC